MNRISNLWHQLRKDKLLLLLCFVLAFLAWQDIREKIGIEVTVSNIAVDVDVPSGWAVLEKSVPRVNIVFRGSREEIRYLNNEQLRVVIPVPDPEHGAEMTIDLMNEASLRNPTGAKVVSFSPSEVVVRLDEESERLLPVKAAVNDSLPDGVEIERIVCTPASVKISGAQKMLDEMINIHTEEIDLKDRQSSFKVSVPIALPQAGRMVVEPDWVSVEIFLEARSSTAVFEKIPIRIMCAPGEKKQIQVVPQFISITVQGQKQQIEKMRASDAYAYVNCYDLTESTAYELPVEINLPANVQMVKTEPATVQVNVTKIK
ncbi:CdaR family protein [Pontiellaceae bacterium B1224]|nr:CdaR family protein [Pontiellaceae bacterium B1224]